MITAKYVKDTIEHEHSNAFSSIINNDEYLGAWKDTFFFDTIQEDNHGLYTGQTVMSKYVL